MRSGFAEATAARAPEPREATLSRDSVNLDVLRSAAVLMVLALHLLLRFGISHCGPLPLLGLGQWGVLIFFFHTSLVLMRSLSRSSRDAARRPSFTQFMLRRCFRLLPLCWLVILVVAFAHIPVGHVRHGEFAAGGLTGAPLLYDFLLIQNLTGTESAVATLWSLPYEMQMYLLLPALFVMARAVRIRVVLWTWLATALTAACYRFNGGERVRDALWLVPCFYAGIVAFKWSAQVRPTWPALLWPLLLACLTLLYLEQPKPSVGALGCLVLGVCQPRIRELRWPVLRVVSQLIARYSYGVYLTHLICMWLAFDLLSNTPALTRWVVFVTTAIAAPVALYHALEHPMIALGSRLTFRIRRRELRKAAFSAGAHAEP